MGDSRTYGNPWQGRLAVLGNYSITDASDPLNQTTMAQFTSTINDRINTVPVDQPPAFVLINIGAHDLIFGLPDAATWISEYESDLDAMHAAWPNAQIYLMRPWQQGSDADAATMHGWIDTVIAARSTFTHAGPDEAVWLKSTDNGATYGTLHYTAAGERECAQQWLKVLP